MLEDNRNIDTQQTPPDTVPETKVKKVKEKKSTLTLNGPLGWLLLLFLICVFVTVIFSNDIFRQYLPNASNNDFQQSFSDYSVNSSRISTIAFIELVAPFATAVFALIGVIILFAISLNISDMKSDMKDIADKIYKDNKS